MRLRLVGDRIGGDVAMMSLGAALLLGEAGVSGDFEVVFRGDMGRCSLFWDLWND